MRDVSMMDAQNGPGSANYNPAYTEQDGEIIYRTRSTRASDPNDPVGENRAPQAESLVPPSPSVGGESGQLDRLGWSNGFLAFRRRSAFTGRVLVRPTMGVHPAVGDVGFSTRSQRLRNKVLALQTDYTPSSQEVAREITENV